METVEERGGSASKESKGAAENSVLDFDALLKAQRVTVKPNCSRAHKRRSVTCAVRVDPDSRAHAAGTHRAGKDPQ